MGFPSVSIFCKKFVYSWYCFPYTLVKFTSGAILARSFLCGKIFIDRFNLFKKQNDLGYLFLKQALVICQRNVSGSFKLMNLSA